MYSTRSEGYILHITIQAENTMTPEALPSCICGAKQWIPGGAMLAPDIHHQQFTCNHCSRPAVDIATAGGHAFMISTEKNKELPIDGVAWINSVLLIAWRDIEYKRQQAREKIETHVWDTTCEKLKLSSETLLKDMKPEQKKYMQDMLKELHASTQWLTPPGFCDIKLPPQLPESLTMYLYAKKNKWHKVDPYKTKDLPIPPDPIRVAHDTYFDDVFYELEKKFGAIDRTRVRNRYTGAQNQPWYEFKIKNFVFVFGPRKRVTAIQATTEGIIATKNIRSIAVADNTTYYADGDWQSDIPRAKKIEVHAWTKDKLIEYLTILIRTSLSKQPA